MEANKERGQALLIVILTMVVALTVGISVVSRSITTLRISTAEEESQRAFSAAEAGIEEVLKSGLSMAEELTLPNQAKYRAVVTPISADVFLVPGITQKDEATQIWLSQYAGCGTPPCYGTPRFSGQLTVYWGESGDSCPNNAAALEVIVFSGSPTSPTVSRYALDPCNRLPPNNFTLVNFESGCIIIGEGTCFKSGYTIPPNPPLISNGLIMRIIPLYKSTRIAIRSWSGVLPSQGKEIESTGKVVSGGQEIVRKIKVFQAHPSLPSIFDQAIFSGTNL